MDGNLLVVIIAIFALVAVAAFFAYRQHAKVDIRGPLGVGLSIDASNRTPPTRPAQKLGNVTGTGGPVILSDETEGGIEAGAVKGKVVTVETKVRPPADPKAKPPA